MPTTDITEQTAKRLGAEVRAARKGLGLDQTELSLVAGVSRRTVYAVEHGKPTIRLDALVPVLRALGLDLVVAPHVGRDRSRT